VIFERRINATFRPKLCNKPSAVISKMTSFADLVKNGVLMIIPIYAKVSFNKSCPLKD
jgi:hypothetical protein